MSSRPGADVVIVDAGGANLGSVRYALERLGAKPRVSSDAATIAAAERVILPGVGSASTGMRRLEELGLVDCVRDLEQPLLGVCLGMQLLFTHSAEGDTPLLGLAHGNVEALRGAPGIRVPHMGWNRLAIQRETPLLAGVAEGAHVYFVHGFAAPGAHPAVVASTTHGETFAAAIAEGNRFGVQFHPERSAAVGARVLANFLALPA